MARGCGRTNGNISQIGQYYTGQTVRERKTDKYRREEEQRININ